jgi:hypothetical protein
MGKMILMNFDKVTKGASAPFSLRLLLMPTTTPRRVLRG